MDKNVVTEIAAHDRCIGCGTCAALCPPQVLGIHFDAFGQYQVTEDSPGCLPNCDLCLRVCPFAQAEHNEDTLARSLFSTQPGIAHRAETGFFLRAFAGWTNDERGRLNAASGGLTSWLLASLLSSGAVKSVLAVRPTENPERLFKYSVLRSPEEIFSSAKSHYYPVEMSEVLRTLRHEEAPCAVVALPCFIKSLRLAMLFDRRLASRVKYLIGLVCGKNMSKFFASYLCATGGGSPQQMTSARWRIKDNTADAQDFRFRFSCSKAPGENNGSKVTSGELSWREAMNTPWFRNYFRPTACAFCDDIFAELADVVLMDAWHKDFAQDSRGTNYVLVRQQSLLDQFSAGHQQGLIHLQTVPIDDLVSSQQAVVDQKRTLLAKRLGLARLLHWKNVPAKRVAPGSLTPLDLLSLWVEHRITVQSKEYGRTMLTPETIGRFNRRMAAWFFLQRLVNYPGVLHNRLRSYLRRVFTERQP